MILYHYTSLSNLRQILDEKVIKTTASNLFKPIAPKLVNGTFADTTDIYKPVVWFTTIDRFDLASGCGLYGAADDKTEAAIVVNTAGPIIFQKWDQWAIKNGIEKLWFSRLKETAPYWETFYVSEIPIPINENTSISFRPDVMQQFMLNQKGVKNNGKTRKR